ncbi:MAG: type II toxin-antitoxin system HigB family toxin [Vulcanimicrobiaceae bacterium]
MRIISKRRLREFWSDHPDAKEPLEAWYRVAKYAAWRNLAETRAVYPHADNVKGYTVFNIRGNTYRLIVKIEYALKIMYIRSLLTHKEYDRGVWK